MASSRLALISIVSVLIVIGVFSHSVPSAYAALSIKITSINNITPRWGLDTVTVSGSLTNFHANDTVTVLWGDGSNSPNNPISGVNGIWGPVSHIYPKGKVGINTIKAQLWSSPPVLLATSTGNNTNVQKHITSLALPNLSSGSVKWGKTYSVTSDTLTDFDAGGFGIASELISFSGNGTTGSPNGTTNGTGKLSSPVIITAPGKFNTGIGNVFANFAGDLNYLPSSSSTTIQITKHATTISTPTLSRLSIPWGQNFIADSIITDTDLISPISGENVTYSGNGTLTKSDFSNSTGHIQTTLTSPGIGHVGVGKVNVIFSGDNNYLSSSSSASSITITRHFTLISNPLLNSTIVKPGKTFSADSVLIDYLLNLPLSGKTVSYSGNGTTSTTSGLTNSTGHLTKVLTTPVVPKSELGIVNATFGGDSNYFAASPTISTLTITVNTNNSVNGSVIKHIVVIVEENRSFDHYFGSYTGVNGIPPNTCILVNPNSTNTNCVKPQLTSNFTDLKDLPHEFHPSQIDINQGAMNGWMAGENNDTSVMEYKDSTVLPKYWSFASRYVLADDFFSSALGWSVPNHWYMVAGQSPAAAIPSQFGNSANPNSTKLLYLQEANGTLTVVDNINNTSVTWKHYDTHFGAIYPGGYQNAVSSGYVYDFWNVFASKASTYTPSYAPHFVPHTQIFTDLQTNSLPQVSWVIPPDFLSDHPPASSHTAEIWVTDVVDAIMNSPYWNSTAIIVTWDDYGGYYDHVLPPRNADTYGLGFRVPTLIISPYAKAGFVDHTQYEFGSILKFIEWRFNLPSMTNRDANANNLLNAFNFSQTPRPPQPIPLTQDDLNQLLPFYIVPNTGHVGDNVKYTGNGFNNGEPGTVKFSGVTVGSALANSSGTFTVTFKVPPSTVGCHPVTDYFENGVLVFGLGLLNQCFNILPNEVLNPTSGISGTSVTVNGTGFAAGNTITIAFDGISQTTSTSDSSGSFSKIMTIPSTTTGTHAISASDQAGDNTTANFQVGNPTKISLLTLNSTSVKWGQQYSVTKLRLVDSITGQGIAATISFTGNGTSGSPVGNTNATGYLISSVSITSPTNIGKTQVIANFAGDSSHSASSASKSLTISKHATIDVLTLPSSVTHGTTYTIKGTLKDSVTKTFLSSKTISFSANYTVNIPNTITSSTGAYQVTGVPAPSTAGKYSVTSKFAGNSLYLASSNTKTLTVN